MSEPWIRVHATLIDKPVVARAMSALGVTEHAAVGLLVTFWGAASRNIIGGAAGAATDAQLEQWARWRGKRGRFAAFIRSHHLDGDGRINEWDDYAGKLEQRREKERERLRNKRNGVAQQTPDVATHARERNDTKRENYNNTPSAAGVREEAEAAALLATDADRNALTVVLRNAREPVGPAIAIHSMLTANDPAFPTVTVAQVGRALRDFATNKAQYSAILFRRYVERAIREDEPTPLRPARPGAGGARNDAAIDAWLEKDEVVNGQ